MNPFVFHAQLAEWQFFVTLTYRSEDEHGNKCNVPDPITRKRMLFQFLREAAKGRYRIDDGPRMHSLPWHKLLWVSREERGEKKGRYHFHILMNGFPLPRENKVECFSLQSIWKDCGGGFADVRLFDARLPGAAYVMKGLDQWSREQANSYELGKFSQDQQDRTLIVSDSCLVKWGQHPKGTRASGGTGTAANAGPSLLATPTSGKRRTKRINETLDELENRIRLNWLNRHPAGVSFVR